MKQGPLPLPPRQHSGTKHRYRPTFWYLAHIGPLGGVDELYFGSALNIFDLLKGVFTNPGISLSIGCDWTKRQTGLEHKR